MDEAPELELPRGIALAWGVAAHPQRGPKRELSIERIVEAAVEIADAEGLAAVSMAAVAARLGFTTMSLYRYVSAKDDLILLMQEFGTGLPPASIARHQQWRDGLRAWAMGTREGYSRHPWLIDIPISGMPVTPNNLSWLDCALGVLSATPLTHEERIGTALLLIGHVRWEAAVNRGYDDAMARAGMAPHEHDSAEAELLSALVTPERFPHLTEAAAGGAFTSQADPFAFGLERILDGVAAYIAARA